MGATYEQHITFDPMQCGGHPCIRGMRIRVMDILGDFHDLKMADIQACLNFQNALTIEQLQCFSFTEELQSAASIGSSTPEAQRQVLNARLAAHEAHPGRGRTWEEIKVELAQRMQVRFEPEAEMHQHRNLSPWPSTNH